jgi:membrane protein
MTWEQLPFVQTVERTIWDTPLNSLPRWQAALLRLTRLAQVLTRDLMSGELALRSMSLVYTTLLSIVPLLALSFSVLKAFGVHNQVAPALRRLLAPLGPQGDEITGYIIEFVERMNVGVLGSLGFALLLYTAVSLVQKIEESFNFIWHIAEPRSMGERFSRYLSVLLVGPILVFSALGVTAAVTSMDLVQVLLTIEPFGWLVYSFGQILPYLLVIAAFTFIYVFVPNTRVRFWPALTGGIVGGLLWQSGGWAFAMFVAASTRYSAIYSGFAILVLFMIWLYLSWLVLLFGAAVAFYRQHPEYILAQSGEPRLSNRMRERLALAVMSLIAQHHRDGQPAWTLLQLAQRLNVPGHAMRAVLGALHHSGVLAHTDADPPAYLPAHDLTTLPVRGVLEAVRSSGEDRYLNPSALPVPEVVEQTLQRIEGALDVALGDMNVAALAADPPASTDADAAPA